MKGIAIIREHDVYPDRDPVPDSAYTTVRIATRMILRDRENKIAALYFPKKEGMNEGYMLPGGGVEPGETLEQGLRREAREETACEIDEIIELGEILQYGVGKKSKHIQHEYLYEVRLKGEKGERFLDQEHIDRGVELRWLSHEELSSAFNAQIPSFSRTVARIALENTA